MKKSIVVYDFDGTLTPYAMPKFEILKKCGIENYAKDLRFTSAIKERIKDKNINFYEAIYEIYFETLKLSGFDLNDKNFCLGVDSVEYNKGVEEFIAFLNKNNVDNYIVSSGIKPYIESTNISYLFKGIYATEFSYDKNGIANGINYLMTDLSKIEAITDIMNKNELKDCSNIIYVGDGLTDTHAFNFVHRNGGKSIYVYQSENDDKAYILSKNEIVDLFAMADFTMGSELSSYIINECDI